jgi:hypothetical protein
LISTANDFADQYWATRLQNQYNCVTASELMEALVKDNGRAKFGFLPKESGARKSRPYPYRKRGIRTAFICVITEAT